jgi:hypothetical protein
MHLLELPNPDNKYSYSVAFIGGRVEKVFKLASRAKKKKKNEKIVILLMTCKIFIVSLLHFELKIYNYTKIIIIE